MVYDVAVVGAGPAGLMAARSAAENGLKAVLIEKRKEIAAIKRACCMQLIMDEDYEGETIRVKERAVVFPRNGFSVDYYGPLLPLTHKYYISPGGDTAFILPTGTDVPSSSSLIRGTCCRIFSVSVRVSAWR